MRQFRTEDGYTFYEQPDGTLTDSDDPLKADITYSSLEELKKFVGVEEIK